MSNLGGESETTKEKHQLLLYEELFSDRFSDNDAEYMRTSQQGERLPPCVENWYTRPKRTFDWTRNQPDRRDRGGYNRQLYGDHSSSRGGYHSNDRQWRDGGRETGGYHSRRDQYFPQDNRNFVHYAGVREQSSSDAPAPKYSRQSNDSQSHH